MCTVSSECARTVAIYSLKQLGQGSCITTTFQSHTEGLNATLNISWYVCVCVCVHLSMHASVLMCTDLQQDIKTCAR